MGSVNKVILVGNLGADPELRYTGKGRAVCHLSLATNSSWKDAEGNRQEETSWHRVVAWGKQGELCKEYLRKGRKVYVEGRLQNRSYEDKSGSTRYATEVVSSSVVFLDRRGEGSFSGGGSQAQAQAAPLPPAQDTEDSVPF
jgi:single-strand DNA-binding protein